jgi:hypothetical protein
MKLATLCIDGQTSAVRIEGRTGVVIDGVADVEELLANRDWRRRAAAAGIRIPLYDLDDLDHVSVSIDVDGRRIARRSHAGTR